MSDQPRDTEAETSVLSSILIDPNLIYRIDTALELKDFFSFQNREVYRAMSELSAKKEPIDVVTTIEKVYSNGKLGDKDKVAEIVSSISNFTFNVELLGNKIRAVKEKSALRLLLQLGSSVSKRAGSKQVEPFDLITDIQRSVGDVLSDLEGVSYNRTT